MTGKQRHASARPHPPRTPGDIPSVTLTQEGFPALYRTLVGTRFPIDVAEVLDLRYLINHSIDAAPPVAETPDYRHFREQLLQEVDRLGVDKKSHSDRLLGFVTLLRGLHLNHSLASRDTEQRLRRALEAARLAHARSIRYGRNALLAMIAAVGAGLLLSAPQWSLYVSVTILGYLAIDYFVSVGAIRRETARLTAELKQLLADRVQAMDWRTLLRNTALILGYKRIPGVEVFLMERDAESHSRMRV